MEAQPTPAEALCVAVMQAFGKVHPALMPDSVEIPGEMAWRLRQLAEDVLDDIDATTGLVSFTKVGER